MKLSDKEATILAAAELRAAAPISLLRKESGYRDHTIRYVLRILQKRGVITPVPFINLHVLGYTIYTMFFSLGSEKRGNREALQKLLLDTPEILWVGEFGGEYQYALGFCVHRFSSMVEVLRGLSKKFPNIFFDKAISVQISSTIFPRKYLTSKKMSVKPLTVTFDKAVCEIDDLDKKILSALTSYSELSYRQLAIKLQMPLSTLELRVKKLREKGVICADIFVFEPSHFQLQSYKLLVYTKGLDPHLSSEMFKFCEAHPNITYLIDGLGSWGYEIGVEVRDAESVTSIIQDIHETFGNLINAVKMLTKFRYPKVRWFPGVR